MRSVVAILIVVAMAVTITGCPKDANGGNGGSEGNGEGGIWHIETVDSEGSVGWSTALALDSAENPHISCRDDATDDLKYAYFK